MFKHELGALAESRVTGVKGVLTNRMECLYGCNRYSIQPKADKDGKQNDAWWVDEGDVIIKGKGVIESVKKDIGVVLTGAPMERMKVRGL